MPTIVNVILFLVFAGLVIAAIAVAESASPNGDRVRTPAGRLRSALVARASDSAFASILVWSQICGLTSGVVPLMPLPSGGTTRPVANDMIPASGSLRKEQLHAIFAHGIQAKAPMSAFLTFKAL